MVSFLTIGFAMSLCFCHRKVIYATLMGQDKILQVYRRNASLTHAIQKQLIFTLPALSSMTDEHESTDKSIATLPTIGIVIQNLTYSLCIWKM